MKQITVLEQEGSGKMAQSLIEQLQLGALDGSAPITDLLRRAKLVAVKLRTVEFTAWAVTQAIPHQIQKMVFNGLGFQCDVKLHVGANEMSRIIKAERNSVLD